MSDESQFFRTLREAFTEIDSNKRKSEEADASSLPVPVPPSKILMRIRANDEESKASPFVEFPQKVSDDRELKLAARKGSEISPDILKKMRDNRDKS